MALFSTSDRPDTRRLLFVVGGALVLGGLALGWVDRDTVADRSPEESVRHVEQIHQRHTAEPPKATTDEHAGAGKPLSEVEALRETLDFSTAPEPRPHHVERDDFDVYVGTTAEFLVWLYEAVGFTADQVAAGDTEAVPPLIIVSIPDGWAEDKSVQLKKSLFYRAMLPAILLENAAVLAERAELEAYRSRRRNRDPLQPAEHERAQQLAVKYRVLDEGGTLDDAALEELMRRVDEVPPSLALGQAAYESGYATSRFAHEANALFGQWDWGKDAVKPKQQRAGKGDYGIKAFPYPIDSVRAYLWNLNTHRSYEAFRHQRATQRDGRSGRVVLDGHALAATLLAYSERGADYTRDLQGIISHNRLDLADGLRLMQGDTIYFD